MMTAALCLAGSYKPEELASMEDWIDQMHEFPLKVPHGHGRKTLPQANGRSVMNHHVLERRSCGIGFKPGHVTNVDRLRNFASMLITT